MCQKKIITVLLFCFFVGIISTSNIYAQTKEGSYFKRNSFQRIHLGLFNSFFSNNIGIMTAGYDYGLKFFRIKPELNLMDLNLGVNILAAFDEQEDLTKDRPQYVRIVPGFELNWNIRLYVLPIQKINTKVYIEGTGMTLVFYTSPYPNNGTKLNIGSHLGLGMDYQINPALRGFTSLRFMHTSNGKSYEKNPAVNAIGIVSGLQF